MSQERRNSNLSVIILGNHEDLDQPQFSFITQDLDGESNHSVPLLMQCMSHPLSDEDSDTKSLTIKASI